jgi:hypothetical protein
MVYGEDIPVNSTNVASVAHDPDNNLMRVTFHHGRRVYEYPADSDFFQKFLSHPSKGTVVNAFLKQKGKRIR